MPADNQTSRCSASRITLPTRQIAIDVVLMGMQTCHKLHRIYSPLPCQIYSRDFSLSWTRAHYKNVSDSDNGDVIS